MKYDCYVYRCTRCGEEFFINKEQDQMKLFTCECKCSHPKNEYLFLGEGNSKTEEIHTIEFNDKKSDTYIRSRLSKNYKNNDAPYEFNLENKE